jgi:hypothetical protein
MPKPTSHELLFLKIKLTDGLNMLKAISYRMLTGVDPSDVPTRTNRLTFFSFDHDISFLSPGKAVICLFFTFFSLSFMGRLYETSSAAPQTG